jgi:quercetin dioxygenase-like cupin family protein
MDGDPDDERLSFLGRRLPPWVELRVMVVAPGHRLASHQADWRDALVVVEGGELEVECLGGSRQRFVCGDLLWLHDLPLRALHNRGGEPAVLTVVTRRQAPMSLGPAGRLNSDGQGRREETTT